MTTDAPRAFSRQIGVDHYLGLPLDFGPRYNGCRAGSGRMSLTVERAEHLAILRRVLR
jgi:hypothetical protein